MQLAKIINATYENQNNEYQSKVKRNISKKIYEAFCALKLEARFSKKEILELYLEIMQKE